MSESIIFDTHRYVKRLTDAGLASPIAEALADEQAQLVENKLATKEDIRQLELKIETTRSDLFKFIAIALSAQAALIVGFLTLIIKFL